MVVSETAPIYSNTLTEIYVQRLQLSIKAELENVTSLVPAEDFEYFFQVHSPIRTTFLSI